MKDTGCGFLQSIKHQNKKEGFQKIFAGNGIDHAIKWFLVSIQVVKFIKSVQGYFLD